jgi:hypothetical protein
MQATKGANFTRKGLIILNESDIVDQFPKTARIKGFRKPPAIIKKTTRLIDNNRHSTNPFFQITIFYLESSDLNSQEPTHFRVSIVLNPDGQEH